MNFFVPKVVELPLSLRELVVAEEEVHHSLEEVVADEDRVWCLEQQVVLVVAVVVREGEGQHH